MILWACSRACRQKLKSWKNQRRSIRVEQNRKNQTWRQWDKRINNWKKQINYIYNGQKEAERLKSKKQNGKSNKKRGDDES